MKSLKTLVCVGSFALCFGAASMANAAYTIAPAGSPFATTGSITVKSPASLQQPVTCNIAFSGQVAADGTYAQINSATVNGSNPLCGVPKLLNLPWKLQVTAGANPSYTGTVSVNFSVVSNCASAAVPIAVTWNNGSNLLSIATQQAVGSCTITALTATPNPAFVISP
ncbi:MULTISPECIES: alkane oxidation protein activator PraB [Pseudomonas]|jgi:hypothetical protein|uniref:Protein activator n=1 Tax=Pseudomonas yamanorum TaxID=515393 RepID=A0A143GG55_9PSED|nr:MULTISPECIES: alkane oxidation protein activator PraB [Pseudomonas]AMW83151.1 protein activator [Pseudomonas yamanorum]MBK5408693.1 protein activator [Pseudomonas sp. TH34]MBV6661557.1 protein activator [Pseudomonas yamanorum]MDR0189946.1 alkane oxidation protein activator PraB [Pseudomonas yamanorum]NVZ89487.1 protein activator [Pseudomonas yamanorum]